MVHHASAHSCKDLVVLFDKGFQLLHKFLHNIHHVLSVAVNELLLSGPA